VTFLVGLIAILFAVGGLASWGFHRDGVMGIAFVALVMLGCVELSLIRLLSRLLGVTKERGGLRQLKRRKEKELAAPQPHYIQPAANYAAPPTSVTDHTTRTFTPAYREPRA
jgi:hypothetical protein